MQKPCLLLPHLTARLPAQRPSRCMLRGAAGPPLTLAIHTLAHPPLRTATLPITPESPTHLCGQPPCRSLLNRPPGSGFQGAHRAGGWVGLSGRQSAAARQQHWVGGGRGAERRVEGIHFEGSSIPSGGCPHGPSSQASHRTSGRPQSALPIGHPRWQQSAAHSGLELLHKGPGDDDRDGGGGRPPFVVRGLWPCCLASWQSPGLHAPRLRTSRARRSCRRWPGGLAAGRACHCHFLPW